VENSFLQKVRSLILEHLEDENFGITMLCDLVNLSRPQLHRKLTAITGESTSSLIRKVQLARAKELLAMGEYNVSEVAYRSGFKTQAHFSRVFSESLGISPSNYLKK
jgi:AraC-like DNA-binding protein